MSENYHRNLSASIYHHVKNVGIIRILAYPKKNHRYCAYGYHLSCNIKSVLISNTWNIED